MGGRRPSAKDRLGIGRRVVCPDVLKLEIVLGIQCAEEFVPEKRVEPKVETRMFMVLCMKRGRSEKTNSRNGSESARQWLNSGMPKGAPKHVQSEIGNQTPERHGISGKEGDHEQPKPNHFQRMQDKQADGIGGFVPVVEPVKDRKDQAMVSQAVQHIHAEIHGKGHDHAIDPRGDRISGSQNDVAILPKPPAKDRNRRIEKDGSDGGQSFYGPKGFPSIEDPSGFEQDSQ